MSTSIQLQVAAIPYRFTKSGKLKILVITSRTRGRLIVPKGWPMKGRADHQAAAIEARQEAGVVGKISPRAIGTFNYEKMLTQGRRVLVRASVFPMEVKRVKSRWKEQASRRRSWLSVKKAVASLDDNELAILLRQWAALIGGKR